MGAPRAPARTVLFRSERGGPTYRVPALLPAQPGRVLLAFAELRLGPEDARAHRLVQRRGALAGGGVRVSAGRARGAPRAGWGSPCRAGARAGGGRGRPCGRAGWGSPGARGS